MTDDRLPLAELMAKTGDGDFLRTIAENVLQIIMEADVDGLVGAGRHERSGDRTTWRNGYRDRSLDTRLGTLNLKIPKLRQGSYFPGFLEPRRTAEKALAAVIQEAYVHGVSTRSVDDLVKAMGMTGISKSQVSRLCEEIDERVHAFLDRPIEGDWPYLWIDATYVKVREAGLKVRVYDQNLAKFIESVGGTPVPLSFNEVHQSLSLGVVDCAITGPSSANSSNWPEVTTHQYALGFQMAMNGYAMTMKSWNRLSPDQKSKMQAAFNTLIDDIWAYSQELTQDAINCNAGKDPCTTGKKFKLINVPVTDADKETVRKAVASISLPTWAEICDKSNPGCSAAWKKTVGKAIGVQ